MSHTLKPAATEWRDLRPDNLPPMRARCLCYNVSSGRVFVAERVPTAKGWAWCWSTDGFVPPDFVDQWAQITLRS